MAWNSIIGQDRVKNILQRATLENRIGHAYIFWGAEGIGKDALALEFAKMLNCDRPVRNTNGIAACDACKSCLQAAHLQHQNIKLIFALPAGKAEDGKSAAPLMKLSEEQLQAVHEQLRLKAENPYHDIRVANAKFIRIAAVREIKKNVMLSASQRGRRVFIISEAETMNSEAANAFLKTLEEPAANVTIILTTSRRDKLLPTILSRCQQIQVGVLPDRHIAEALQERLGVAAEQARLIARLADGSYTRACELLQEDLQQLRQDVVQLFRSILKRRNYILQLSHDIEDLAADKNRTKIEQMLTLLLLWLRDAYALSVSHNPDVIVNIDQVEDLQRFVRNFQQADLVAASQQVEDAIYLVRQNVHLFLALSRLAIQLRAVFLRTAVS